VPTGFNTVLGKSGSDPLFLTPFFTPFFLTPFFPFMCAPNISFNPERALPSHWWTPHALASEGGSILCEPCVRLSMSLVSPSVLTTCSTPLPWVLVNSNVRSLHMPVLCRFAHILAVAAFAIAPLASLAGDGYPTDTTTPEGAACDFARAFIHRDVALFEQVILPPFGGGESRTQYEGFLAETKSAISEESKRPAERGPREISKVFVARSLSKSGPASYAYAVFNFADVKFVDVYVVLYGGGMAANRTLVIMDNAGRWRVHPAPNIHPLLSYGLNQESPSTEEVERKRALPGEPRQK